MTIGLAIPAMLLLCFVLSEGWYLWWTNAPVLGWALAAALPLLALLFFLEDRRARPLLWVRWYATRDIALFAAIALGAWMDTRLQAAVALVRSLGGGWHR
ncbi:hypothetical protein [Sphingomonas pituitosa]|uniref:hypothetical protein n=1 Tax=Sphingomonas pituitosa TaxID=99597 RepID=UPI00082F22A5|nr:hypothetical protein [Sphingomonas pituitosa]